MATYKQIQDYVKKKYGYVPKSCWIAHVKEMSNLPVRKAHNRRSEKRVVPCPSNKIESIKDALRAHGMIT